MEKDKLVIFVLVVGIIVVAVVGKQKGWWSGSFTGESKGNDSAVLQGAGNPNTNTTTPPQHQEPNQRTFVTDNGSTVTKGPSEWVQPGGNWFSNEDRTTPAYGGMAGGGWSYQAPVYTDRPNPYVDSSWFSPDDKTNAAYTNVKNATFRPAWQYTDRPNPYAGVQSGSNWFSDEDKTNAAYTNVKNATFAPSWEYTDRALPDPYTGKPAGGTTPSYGQVGNATLPPGWKYTERPVN